MPQLTLTINLPDSYDVELVANWLQIGHDLERSQATDADEATEVETGSAETAKPQRRRRRTKAEMEADAAAPSTAVVQEILPPPPMTPPVAVAPIVPPPPPVAVAPIVPPPPAPIQVVATEHGYAPVQTAPVGHGVMPPPAGAGGVYTVEQLRQAMNVVPNAAALFMRHALMGYGWQKVEDVPVEHLHWLLHKLYSGE